GSERLERLLDPFVVVGAFEADGSASLKLPCLLVEFLAVRARQTLFTPCLVGGRQRRFIGTHAHRLAPADAEQPLDPERVVGKLAYPQEIVGTRQRTDAGNGVPIGEDRG